MNVDAADASRQGPDHPTGSRLWVAGARPRTLPAAVVPVSVGGSGAFWAWRIDSKPSPVGGVESMQVTHDLWHSATVRPLDMWWTIAALVIALGMQVGTNYANDYSDGIRGTDRDRVGPLRLVGSGLASPAAVKAGAWISFGVAGAVGLWVAAAVGWWLVLVGSACVGAGWLYTGGPRPYGYMGLGEVFVFVFFGLVATAGTAYIDRQSLSPAVVLAAVAVGLLATSLLEANNLRDIEGDALSSKRTLAVRLGRGRAGWLYAGSLSGVLLAVVAIAIWFDPWVALAVLASPLAVGPVRLALGPSEAKQLLPMLPATGRLQVAVGALMAAGFLIGGVWR